MAKRTSTFELPWPPSANKYYRHVGRRVLLSREGRAYRKRVAAKLVNELTFGDSRISVMITACPPDRRRRDLDNLLKCVQDSIQHAGGYQDDGQIDDLRIIRGPIEKEKGGALLVSIREL